jgi:polyferredoxin
MKGNNPSAKSAIASPAAAKSAIAKQVTIRSAVTRLVIQAVFFILLPALFSAAFNGVKYLANQIGQQEAFTWNPFLAVLVVLLASTILFGRFFCGYACSFGSLGDWLFYCSAFIQKKIFKRVLTLPEKIVKGLQYLKYVILIGIVAACLTGTYSDIGPADPWELFAAFRAGNFSLGGQIYMSITFGLIVIGMLFVERFFCQFLCPMGAVFALMPLFPLTIFNRKKEDCIKGCHLCVKTCPADISLGEVHSKYGECFQCGKCSAKCPRGNIRLGFRKWRGTEIALPVAKAALLIAVSYPIMHFTL